MQVAYTTHYSLDSDITTTHHMYVQLIGVLRHSNTVLHICSQCGMVSHSKHVTLRVYSNTIVYATHRSVVI